MFEYSLINSTCSDKISCDQNNLVALGVSAVCVNRYVVAV